MEPCGLGRCTGSTEVSIMRIALVAFTAALLTVTFAGGSAEAKGPPIYTLTGGALSEQAVPFRAPGGYLLLGTNAEQVERPSALVGVAYDIYTNAAYTYGSRRPDFRYYPGAALIRAVGDGTGWHRLDAGTASFLDRTIEDARSQMTTGQLARNPVEAVFRASHIDVLQYTVRREPISGSAPVELSAIDSVCACPVPVELVPSLIMIELVRILSQAPKGVTLPKEVILISQDNAQGYGALGCYAPPNSGQPGRFWLGCPPLWQSGTPYFHETTAGFDAIIHETIEVKQAGALVPQPTAPLAPPPAAPFTVPSTPAASWTLSLAGIAAALAGAAGLRLARRFPSLPLE